MLRMFLLGSVLAFTGCTSFTSGFQKGFEKGFEKSFMESCVRSASKSGASADVINKYCDCAMKKFEKTKSMDKAAAACAPN